MAESAAKRLLKDLKHIQVWRERIVFIFPEAEFLDEIQTEVLKGFLLDIHSHL